MNKFEQKFPLNSQVQQSTIRSEICSIAAARRVAAMLDLNPDDVIEGAPLPRGWQFILMGADTRRSQLRADGFPGLGVVMQDFGLPRLLLGSRSVLYASDILIGASVTRTSSIQSVTQKTSKMGPMAIAVIQHELTVSGETSPALIETQTYLLLPATNGAAKFPDTEISTERDGYRTKTVVPDETLLFQYSALGFNSHKIHIDRAHARNVEGYPDLVVNGGLATLLLTEFLRQQIGIKPASIQVRHAAPLFCGRPITMVANKKDSKWLLQAFDNRSALAVDMEVETNEL